LEKTEKHQENEVNDEEFNWNNVKRGNLKYWSNYMSVGNQFHHKFLEKQKLLHLKLGSKMKLSFGNFRVIC